MLSTPQLCVSTYDVQMTTQISLTVMPVYYKYSDMLYAYSMGDIGIILMSVTGHLPLCWIYILKCKRICFCLTMNFRLMKDFDKFVWKLIIWWRDASKSRTTLLFVQQFDQVKNKKLQTSEILAFCEENPLKVEVFSHKRLVMWKALPCYNVSWRGLKAFITIFTKNPYLPIRLIWR